MKRILVIPEYWLPHIHYLIQAFRLHPQPGIELYWTNEKWWRSEEHGPREDTESVKFMPIAEAMTALRDGAFDAAVFSEGSLTVFLGIHPDTKKIFLDSADHRYLVKQYLDHSSVYLKSQAPGDGKMLIGDSMALESMYGGEKIVMSWPYCPSSWIAPSWEPPGSPRKPLLHFRGWSWPAKRVATLEGLRKASVPICGGLHQRSGIQMNVDFHPDLRADKIPFQQYLDEIAGCTMALNAIGNGEMCFRTCEIWRTGTCMVTLPIDVQFPGRAPKNGEEWVMVEDPAKLPGTIMELLKEPELCAKIGEAGRRYWRTFQGPEAWSRRFAAMIAEI